MVIDISTIDKKKYLSEIYYEYRSRGNKLSYEEFIIELEKEVFLWLRDDILEFGERVLPIPNEFYTFRTDEVCPVDGSDNEVCAKIDSIYSTKKYKRSNKAINKMFELSGISEVINVRSVKIGVTVDRDTSIASFIEFIGHEMVHYFSLAYLKFDIPDSHGIPFKAIQRLFNKALRKHGYKFIKIQTISTRSVNSIDPDLLTILAKKYD